MPLVADGTSSSGAIFSARLTLTKVGEGGWVALIGQFAHPNMTSKESNASSMRRTQGRQQDTAKILYFLPDLEDERSVVWLDFRIKRLLLDATSNEGPA